MAQGPWFRVVLALAVASGAGARAENPSLLYTIDGRRELEYLGSSMAATGDVNGDSVPDFALTRNGHEGQPGSVLVVSGGDGSVIHELDAGDGDIHYGKGLWSGGDLDGDGVQDLLIDGHLRFDIRPHDPEISRHHAMITFTGSGFVVKDTGSTNGTFVNEAKVEPQTEAELRHGDILRVGRTSMKFEFQQAS